MPRRRTYRKAGISRSKHGKQFRKGSGQYGVNSVTHTGKVKRRLGRKRRKAKR